MWKKGTKFLPVSTLTHQSSISWLQKQNSCPHMPTAMIPPPDPALSLLWLDAFSLLFQVTFVTSIHIEKVGCYWGCVDRCDHVAHLCYWSQHVSCHSTQRWKMEIKIEIYRNWEVELVNKWFLVMKLQSEALWVCAALKQSYFQALQEINL